MITINEEAEKKLIQLADEVNIKNKNLKKTNEELDRFVYSASHDLRAPLMSVKGLVSLAEKETTDARLQEYLGMIHGQTEKLDHFIKDIISYSRNGRTELVWESINLSQLINACVDNLKFMPDVAQISLIQEFDVKEVFILDKSRMQIVLNNIISNAFKYQDLTKDKCWVKIKAEKNQKQITIQIQDNGVGIPLDRQAKIFDMFYRATEESHGSGIGLYIAKEAAEKMGGTIEVESTYGQGTTFTINIPVHTDHPTTDHQ
jgi:signal transduction histidine kinase